jgi:hypothetical protein
MHHKCILGPFLKTQLVVALSIEAQRFDTLVEDHSDPVVHSVSSPLGRNVSF